jgi:hypothetical protein
MRRRELLRLAGLSGVVMASGLPFAARALAPRGRAAASPYGRWLRRGGLPAFVYAADHETLAGAEWDPILAPLTRRHWLMVGNPAIRLQVANDGTVALFDEGDGLRWLTAPDPAGTGVSVIIESDGTTWGSDYAQRGGEVVPLRTFGPTWFEVVDQRAGLTLERLVLCPEGERPWVLVRVRLRLAADASARIVSHIERWALRPRFCNFLLSPEQRRLNAERAVSYVLTPRLHGIEAAEQFASPNAGGPIGAAARTLIGPPATLRLEYVGGRAVPVTTAQGSPHPTLESRIVVPLRPGQTHELWFRFGRADDEVIDPARVLYDSRRGLARRLPRAGAALAPEARHEIPWHAALLTGGLGVDRVIGGHTLNQGSAYAYTICFNGAARDPLQHALPLVYLDPPRALSVLRNTCAWADVDGDLPYALDPAKIPASLGFRPSDQNLWALWLAAEYAAATGDLTAFDTALAYHPSRAAEPVPLREHLRRQFRFFVDEVGRGEGDHVRILNADWNDVAISDSGVDRETMIERGGSVLNSAMASWVLGVFGGLAERLGETALATEARSEAEALRLLVAQAWNGRWFHRAYAPGAGPVGDDDCWLEVQPWALLCGAADAHQAESLLATIDGGHRAGSPVGTRLRWPAPPEQVENGTWGDGTSGGIWYAIDMTLVWAAARIAPQLAWDAWRRMSLAAHSAAYPTIWEGTLSGPDSWNGPESTRPGRTWAAPPVLAMQTYPVNNNHSHAQPILAYLRLLGVEPTPRGTLAVGQGGRFRSESFHLGINGHGKLQAAGAVTVESAHGTVSGTGTVTW